VGVFVCVRAQAQIKMIYFYLAFANYVKTLKTPALNIGATSINSNGSVTHLGVMFDKCISMHEHVTSVC